MSTWLLRLSPMWAWMCCFWLWCCLLLRIFTCILYMRAVSIIQLWWAGQSNRPYRLFTFDPMASFPCLPVLARHACAWRLHLMFPARICCFFILSPITNLSLNVLCMKHEDWCHTKTRLLGQKWINGKVYCYNIYILTLSFKKEISCFLIGLQGVHIRRVCTFQAKIWI